MTIQSFIEELATHSVRLWVEGGQLRFSAPKGVVQGDLRERILTLKPDLIAYLSAENTAPQISPAAPMQEMLWSLCQRAFDWPALYIEARAVRLTGPLDIGALEQAVAAMITRHDALRTSFLPHPDGLKLRIQPRLLLPIEHHDLTGAPKHRIEAAVRELAWRPFDLEKGPLIRIGLIAEAPNRWVLILGQHHLITDGWSAGLLINEMSERYDAILTDRTANLPPLRSSFADYALDQRAAIKTPRHRQNLDHWQQVLSGIPDLLTLPTDRPFPLQADYRGDRVTRKASRALLTALDAYCRAESTTLFMVAYAAQAAFLHRLTGQETLVMGTPVAGRLKPKYEDLAGCFVNTLALRADPKAEMTFTELSAQTRDQAFKAFDHQDMPFGHLVGTLPIDRDRPHPPVFQTMMAVQNVDSGTLMLGPVTLEDLDLPLDVAKFPLMLTFLARGDGGLARSDGGGGIDIFWDYQTALFDAATVERYADCFMTLLADALAHPDKALGDLALLPVAMAETLRCQAMPSPVPYPREESPWSLFLRQVERRPEAIALAFGEDRLTYHDLAQCAEHTAGLLWAAGVRNGDRIGILLPRGPGLIVSQLAASRIGAAYVPLDQAYPEDRLALMVGDAQPRVLIADEPVLWCDLPLVAATIDPTDINPTDPGDEAAPLPPLPDMAEAADQAETMAYVMYTSGSTGQPKGVAVPNRGVTRLVFGTDYIPFGPDLVFLQLASPSFDASTLEIWGALLHGAKLVLPPVGPEALDHLGSLIARHSVSVLWLTSGLFSTLVDNGIEALSGLRYLLVGGDALSPGHVARAQVALPKTRFVNGYGPTENTTFTCCHPLGPKAAKRITIGRPIANTTAHILDARGVVLPPGVPGTLWTGGDGLAQGYLNQPKLTAERFTTLPVQYGETSQTERLYDTGDLARWIDDPDGEDAKGNTLVIEILGRADSQVKIRGFRVEISEVEKVLEDLPGVSASAVVVGASSSVVEKHLIAFYVPTDAASSFPKEEDLRQRLHALLPDYMCPRRILPLRALPITPNGKLDRHALIRQTEKLAEDSATPVVVEPPTTATERTLAEAWCQLFNRTEVSRTDHFFELGGNSLSAIRMLALVREKQADQGQADHEQRPALTIRDIFDAPVLHTLAKRIEKARSTPSDEAPAFGPSPLGLPPRNQPLSFAQERVWTLENMVDLGSAYAVPGAYRLTGPLNIARLEAALATTLARHPSLSVVFGDQDGAAVQHLVPPPRLPLTPHLLAPEALHAALTDFAGRPFDLREGPLVRAALFQCGPDDHVFALSLHHLVCDGWSIGLLLGDLAQTYAGKAGPPPPLAYADFAIWQRSHLSGERLERLRSYWTETLANLPVLDLPLDHIRPAVPSNRGAHVPITLPAAGLDALAQGKDASRFMVCLAVFAALLHRYSGQDDFAIGTPISGRHHPGVGDLVGFFADNLVLRTPIDPGMTFTALLENVRKRVLFAFDHQDLPFTLLLEAVNPPRRMDMSPLFQVTLTLDDGMDFDLDLAGLTATPIPLAMPWAKYDLGINLRENAATGVLSGHLEYNTDIFSAASAATLARHFEILASEIAKSPETPLKHLDLRTAAERARSAGLVGRRIDHPFLGGLHHLIHAQALRTPDAIALISGDRSEQLTFATVEYRAGIVATCLQAAGSPPGSRVGVFVRRSIDLPVILLGLLKAGCAYVPLNPDHPPNRLSLMVQQVAPTVIIHSEPLPEALSEAPTLSLATIWAAWTSGTKTETAAPVAPTGGHVMDPEDPAYILFTSGSTGVPKGVVIPHRAVCNHAGWFRTTFGTGPEDVMILTTSFDFDASVIELFAPLLSGARLVVPSQRQDDIIELSDQIRDHGVTILQAVPSLFRIMLSDGLLDDLTALRLLLPGGEALPRTLARDLKARLPGCHLFNCYGPTETCIDAVFLKYQEDMANPIIPIGGPIDNTDVTVVDSRGIPLADGLPGELVLSGKGMALGYLNAPDLTAQKFLPPPAAEANGVAPERSVNPSFRYKTGDLARMGPHGIEYLGRIDAQLKINGIRIEANEIEQALMTHPRLRDAAVTTVDADVLAFLVVGTGTARSAEQTSLIDPEEIRATLASHVPSSVNITHLVYCDALPRLSSDKVDRRSLKQRAIDYLKAHKKTGEPKAQSAPPQNALEQGVFEIWAEVLGHGNLNRQDNFFVKGGHSLRAVQVIARLRSRMGVALSVRDIFECPTIAALAQRINGISAASIPEGDLRPVLRATPREAQTKTGAVILPVSHTQRALWFLDRLEGGSAAYTTVSAFLLEGSLDQVALQKALDDLLIRHEVLRTRFAVEGDTPVQIIDPPAPFPVILHRDVLEDDPKQLRTTAQAAANRLFDLAHDFPIRFELWPLSSGRLLGVLSWHHIATDGWSQGVFLSDFASFYRARLLDGNEAILPPLPFQYGDYCLWQRDWLTTAEFEQKRTYWREALADAPQSLSLFTDHPRPSRLTFRGATHRFRIAADQAQRMRTLGQQTASSLYMVGLAVLFVLLHRWSRQNDILVGTPVANRPNAEAEKLIGFFVNTLVMRGRIDRAQSFTDFLAQIRQTTLGAFANQEFPFERLVEDLSPDRHLDHAPLFQVMFNLQNHSTAPLELPGLRMEELEIDTGTAKFDINLTLIEQPDGSLEGYWEYGTDLFAPATAAAMVDQYLALLHRAVTAQESPLGQLPLMDAALTERVLALGTGVFMPRPVGEGAAHQDLLLHHLVETQVARTPDAIAVEFGETRMTYCDLNHRADALAHRLLGLAIQANERIGVDMDRSADMVVALLGILKAGAAYVPLDRTLPPARTNSIIADAGLRFLVTDREDKASDPTIAGITPVLMGRTPPEEDSDETRGRAENAVAPTAGSPVYQLYTSGSTGKPKGVRMPHRALVNLVLWQLSQAAFKPTARTLQFTTLGFDVASQEIFTTLAGGGTLVMMPFALRQDMPALIDFAADRQIERLFLPFTALQQIAEAWPLAQHHPKSLREVLTAGEQLRVTPPLRALFRALPGCVLTNQYGPTETHVASALTLSPDPDDWPEFPSIGSPIANTTLYVLDEDGQLLPPGLPGQLWIGGAAVGDGYPGQPELTEDLFRPNPFPHPHPEDNRIYATGDLARFRLCPDTGQTALEYLGRMDQQIKIRGYRIEPAEIELALSGLEGIAEATVIAWEDATGEKRLVAYYVLRSGLDPTALSPQILRANLGNSLPEYMIPTLWVRLDALPQTPSGKVNRLALPAPNTIHAQEAASVERAAPRSDTEQKLAAIWAEILECGTVGLHDNFFDLGGYSFLLLRVLAEIHRQFPDASHIIMVHLFEHPTIASLAALIDGSLGNAPARHRGEERRNRMNQMTKRRAARGREAPGAGETEA